MKTAEVKSRNAKAAYVGHPEVTGVKGETRIKLPTLAIEGVAKRSVNTLADYAKTLSQIKPTTKSAPSRSARPSRKPKKPPVVEAKEHKRPRFIFD